jgi:beta-xylosidase
VSDQGDGTYRNPILFADYSDPDVVRVGDDFWLTASSFNCTPGLPILYSRDLVNWTIVNHAIDNIPDPRYARVQHGEGVWAPAIRHHAGKFWIFFPTPDEGIYSTTADDPRGQWSEPHLVIGGKGLIDPCPLWDDDGKAYLVHAFAGSRTGGYKNRLRVCPMAPDGSKLLSEGEIVVHDPEKFPTLEGPKFEKRERWYYILAPAGGVAHGFQVAFRSRSVYGPYEHKIVLARGRTPINGPHQGALVDTPDRKEWWFVHFQEWQPYGRIVHLQPVEWRDGWPMMGINQDTNGTGEPVQRFRKPSVTQPRAVVQTPATSDEFDDPKRLALQWQWHANYDGTSWHSLSDRPGWIRLRAHHVDRADLWQAPNLLMQKPPAESFSVETRIDFGALPEDSRAGIVVMGMKHAALVVERDAKARKRIVLLIDGAEAAAADVVEGAPIRLKMQMRAGGACTFAHAPGGGPFEPIGAKFQAVEGKWIGAKVGLCCVSACDKPVTGHADFDYFRFAPD